MSRVRTTPMNNPWGPTATRGRGEQARLQGMHVLIQTDVNMQHEIQDSGITCTRLMQGLQASTVSHSLVHGCSHVFSQLTPLGPRRRPHRVGGQAGGCCSCAARSPHSPIHACCTFSFVVLRSRASDRLSPAGCVWVRGRCAHVFDSLTHALHDGARGVGGQARGQS